MTELKNVKAYVLFKSKHRLFIVFLWTLPCWCVKYNGNDNTEKLLLLVCYFPKLSDGQLLVVNFTSAFNMQRNEVAES